MTEEKAQPQGKRPLTLKLLDQQLCLMNARIDILGSAFERYEKREEERQERTAAAKPEYTEADALRRCITALDAMPRRGNDMSTGRDLYTGGNLDYVKRADIRRILIHLASRFGVDLVEVREQPCSRAHVNPMAQQQLQDAIYNFNANLSSDGA